MARPGFLHLFHLAGAHLSTWLAHIDRLVGRHVVHRRAVQEIQEGPEVQKVHEVQELQEGLIRPKRRLLTRLSTVRLCPILWIGAM